VSGLDPIYATENVSRWENSSLDARIYAGADDEADTARIDKEALVEFVYHAAAAHDFDAAAAILYNRLYIGPKAYVTNGAGSYELALDALTQFYPSGDLALDPRTGSAESRRWLIHETALCLHALGRLPEATAMENRAATASLVAGDLHNAAIALHNLAETYLANGALESAKVAATSALKLAEGSGDREDVLVAYTVLGRIGDLTEDYLSANDAFQKALTIAVEETSVPMLYSLSGVRYAEHLLLSGELEASLAVARGNLGFCTDHGWQSDVALTLAQLSRIPFDVSQSQRGKYSETAVDLARSLGGKQVLTEALLARGRFLREEGAVDAAMSLLNEALTIAQACRLRRAEVDARLLLADAYLLIDDETNGRAEADLAARRAGEVGYVRGQRSAEQLLAARDEQI